MRYFIFFTLGICLVLLPLPAHAKNSYALECTFILGKPEDKAFKKIIVTIDAQKKKGTLTFEKRSPLVLDLAIENGSIMLSGYEQLSNAIHNHMVTLSPWEDIYKMSKTEHVMVNVTGTTVYALMMTSEQGNCTKQ